MREAGHNTPGYRNPTASGIYSLFDFEHHQGSCPIKPEYYFRWIASLFRAYSRRPWLRANDDWYRQGLPTTKITLGTANLSAAILMVRAPIPEGMNVVARASNFE